MTGVLLCKKLQRLVQKHEEQAVISLILRASIWDQALMAHKLQQNCKRPRPNRDAARQAMGIESAAK
jgi:hypothetical protein